MKRRVIAGLIVLSASAAVAAQQVPKGQMPSLGRPTQADDTVPLFDFDNYFLGKWNFEWSMPETVLGPAGPYTGTTTVTRTIMPSRRPTITPTTTSMLPTTTTAAPSPRSSA